VLEALAAGRALVTTPLAIRGIALPRDAACVIDMRRTPDETASVIRSLLANPPRRRELGERAQQVCDRYTRDRFFTALDAMWGSLALQVPPKAQASRYSGMRIERE
jgi:glycosyltransferase involved in cell wall biosynthesis